jgi:GDP-L-fucose synthase
MIDLSTKRILVTGGNGFLGQNIVRVLRNRGCEDVVVPQSRYCDLRILENIRNLLDSKFDIVIHAAGQAGGIGLNQARPAELFYNNLMMGAQLIHESYKANVEKFVQIGTICEYPKFTPVPFSEKDLWNGFPEETNSAYGVSKKSLLVMGQAYRQQYNFNVIHLLPVNLYGPNDNFKEDSSHVIPALIRKFVEAKKTGEDVTIWGDGKATREFLYVDDCAEAIVRATESYDDPDPINIGAADEISIAHLVGLIANYLDFRGKIVYDVSKPNGQPRRSLNTARARYALGFEAHTNLLDGLKRTIDWYLTQETL